MGCKVTGQGYGKFRYAEHLHYITLCVRQTYISSNYSEITLHIQKGCLFVVFSHLSNFSAILRLTLLKLGKKHAIEILIYRNSICNQVEI
jgi:hypothetical protein